MGVPAGPWYIDDLLTFTANTHRFDTGAGTDADSVPTYRVYEDETGTAILNGSMAKLDDANTVGFYSEQLTLSAANGFEVGKSYSIYVTTAVNSVTGTQSFNFKVIAATYPANVTQFGGSAGTFSSGRPEVNTTHIAGSAVSTSSAQIGVNVVNAGGTAWASGAITAAVFAADAITAAKVAADVSAEIADAVWDEDATGHQTGGTFGQAIGDPGADTDTIWGIVNAIGATGSGLSAIPWNAAWDAEVQSEVDDALVAQNLDHLVKIAVDTDFATTVHANSVVGHLADNGAGFDRTTDSLEAIRDNIGTAGAGLTNIDLPDQTFNITGNLSGSVGSVTGNVGGNVAGSVGSVAAGGIAAASFAAGAIDATAIADGAIDAGAIAANAITAAKVAADVSAEIADQVWEEAIADHSGTVGSTAEALNAAGSAGDPWTTALPGAYGAGSAGFIIGTNINATISSRASQASVDTIDDFVDTEVSAIKAKTDQLTFTVANQVDVNIESVNGTTVNGSGTAGDPWGP